ncbi:MAG: hypothetical protein COU11_00230 [Candidatus Harrisonbacteria bacterium CG10_big_fil_rev_8_21_14_0_10_49_15]|uniref:LamG-like jellyroll fold domain-containing protein n=1 Tax=Candidatus Harrisonbacteria bacterium CG10_big_fil_rev_8_21_14_0_10_49_15 TaxID=1974587 RepID=A0A2H0ULZ2_9BACT|nr:MAG: hypothetical protein COU11_00230 [Candidatus Harrisonbacteria bacterium CG10_big_fil_rev_8_21_14_0_10_49_15]
MMSAKKKWVYPALVSSRDSAGFTLIELLIVMGILAVLAIVSFLVINPAQLYSQARDAIRLVDLKAMNSATSFATVLDSTLDLDGSFTNTCSGQVNQSVYVSVPSDNGEVAPAPPSGWSYKQVLSADSRAVAGNGWVPINFEDALSSIGILPPLIFLPVDPVNTFASGNYYTYVCGSFEFTAVLESDKYARELLKDGGDDVEALEVGNDLALSPTRAGLSGGGSSVPTDGLVVYYSFDDSDVTDKSGNGHSGSLVGPGSWAPGRKGMGLSFNGGGYVNMGANSFLDTSVMTVSVWVKTDITSPPVSKVVYVRKNTHDGTVDLRQSTSNHWEARVRLQGSEGIQRLVISDDVATQAWTHLAVTYDGNELKLYVNGVLQEDPLVASGSIDTDSHTSNNLGRNSDGNSGTYFTGDIDEFRIYNRALTASEITALAAQ